MNGHKIPTNDQRKSTSLSDALDGSVLSMPEQHEWAGIDATTDATLLEQTTHAILCLDGRVAGTLKETRKCRTCGRHPWHQEVTAFCARCKKVLGPCCRRDFEGQIWCGKHYVIARILWLFQIT